MKNNFLSKNNKISILNLSIYPSITFRNQSLITETLCSVAHPSCWTLSTVTWQKASLIWQDLCLPCLSPAPGHHFRYLWQCQPHGPTLMQRGTIDWCECGFFLKEKAVVPPQHLTWGVKKPGLNSLLFQVGLKRALWHSVVKSRQTYSAVQAGNSPTAIIQLAIRQNQYLLDYTNNIWVSARVSQLETFVGRKEGCFQVYSWWLPGKIPARLFAITSS